MVVSLLLKVSVLGAITILSFRSFQSIVHVAFCYVRNGIKSIESKSVCGSCCIMVAFDIILFRYCNQTIDYFIK